ncbi:MAG: DUF6448 family protein [Bacillota bacterium]|nr:DUF6448 family protein [Bacillota bacterium]MDW7678831.1 DUF6448 family protein [Bacillota bacterium]
MLQMMVIFTMAVLMILALPKKASAHCDTMDGPTAIDGMKALETKNINHALKWIMPEGEEELANIFQLSLKVRELNDDAKEVADRYFLENLVRIHRAGEGAPYTGLQPAGVPIDEKVAAADKCIEIGNLLPLEGLASPEEMPELEKRLHKALALKDFDVNDVQAGREYIEAYVSFFKFAEGEDHDHGHGHAHEAAETLHEHHK